MNKNPENNRLKNKIIFDNKKGKKKRMVISLSHRYVSDVSNQINCIRTNNSKKCCKNCNNCELFNNQSPKIYICHTIVKLAKKSNPMIDDNIEVEVLPNYVCSKWTKKK